MRVVTRRTGLSADLLRAWERRYEVVKPSRSEGGRRLYSDTDIERLRLLYRATLAGRSIGQVADLSTEALSALARQDAEADAETELASQGAHGSELLPSPPAAGYLADCIRSAERLDALGLDATLRRAAVALPAAALIDGVVVPLLERLGTGWREGTLRPAHGHLASAVLRRLLERVIESASSPLATANLVVATPVGQVHEFGALVVAAVAAAEGWRVTYLGTDLPAEDIAEAAARTRARAAALSVVFPAGDTALADELRHLRAALPKDVTLVVGGAAASAYSGVLDEIGAARLNDLEAFRAHLRTLWRARSARALTRGASLPSSPPDSQRRA
jgi:DNA-binding transcriptional MerR regulator/methylmalonyl-CoA mutase cobalamin-binding subunit